MKNVSLGMSSSPFQKTFEKKNIFFRHFLLFPCILLLTTPVSCITGGLDKIPIGECFLFEKLIENHACRIFPRMIILPILSSMEIESFTSVMFPKELISIELLGSDTDADAGRQRLM